MDSAPRHIVMVSAPARQTVWWVMTVLLAVIATALVLRWDEGAWSRSAWAQMSGTPGSMGPGARGIYAFSGQISSKSYGLFMVDVDTATVWCYEMARGPQGEPRLQLVAARSWLNDRYLEEFNVAAPTPTEVRQLVEQQQAGAKAAGNRGGPAGLPGPGTTSPASELKVPTVP